MNAILLAFQSDKAIKSYRNSKIKQFLPHNDGTTITRHHSSFNIKL